MAMSGDHTITSFWTCLLLFVPSLICGHVSKMPKLLLVSFDGFRWDYLQKTDTPYFDFFIKHGVHAQKGIENVYITKTFPNHFSIVSGLYEESHGIVGNVMFDKRYNETFTIKNETQAHQSKWFDDGGEPIWVTNQKQSDPVNVRRSGSMFWPATLASIKGFLPYRVQGYDPTVDFRTRIDKILSWFEDEYPINLGLLYFEEPDETGHKCGPESVNMTKKIAELDKVVGHLLDKIRVLNLSDLNVIITSDHGMVTTPENKVIDLDQYIDPSTYRIFSANPIANILPNTEEIGNEIYKNMSSVPHVHVYWKENIPSRYHYQNNIRIQPILIDTDEGYQLRHNKSVVSAGQHGYDNKLPSMHPLFVAVGPAFHAGAHIESFHTVDIYEIMCHILHLEPAPNNGSLGKVMSLFVVKADTSNSTFLVYVTLVVFIGLVGGVFGIAACQQQVIHIRRSRLHIPSVLMSKSSNGRGHLPLLFSDEEDDDEF